MKAIVLGCAASVHDDYKAATKLFKPDFVVAVNDVGMDWPDYIDHWASCHIQNFPNWILQRASNGFEAAGQLWTNDTKIPHLSPAQKSLGYKGAPYFEGSSGALGVSVAKAVMAENGVSEKDARIVLCGLPLTNGPHYYGGEHDFTWEKQYQSRWQQNQDKLTNVRSMSGWTADLLGKPTKAWLKNGVRPVEQEVSGDAEAGEPSGEAGSDDPESVPELPTED